MNEQPLTIGLDSRLAVNPNLVLRIEDDDCALLFDPDNGSVQVLNQTAVEIWRHLDGRRSLRQVLASLRDSYEEMDAVADQQVLDLVNTLWELGAVGVPEQT